MSQTDAWLDEVTPESESFIPFRRGKDAGCQVRGEVKSLGDNFNYRLKTSLSLILVRMSNLC
jgi:hypothetical protein